MKTKLKLSGLFLAALMLFSLTACGKDSPEPSSTSEETEQTKPPVEAGSGTTIHTNLWDLTYDEADGWVYEEDDFYDNDEDEHLYDIYLRPWGTYWDDVTEEDLPYYYYDWYLPLIESGESMPDSIG